MYKEIFDMAASAGALEGYVYPDKVIDAAVLTTGSTTWFASIRLCLQT